MSNVRVTHSSSGTIVAEGPVGWMSWLPNPLLPFMIFRVLY